MVSNSHFQAAAGTSFLLWAISVFNNILQGLTKVLIIIRLTSVKGWLELLLFGKVSDVRW